MTEPTTRNITPDGLTGMLFALEGIKNTVVLLNGPMGCKFYHSTTSQFLTIRPPLYLPSEDGSGRRTPVNYNFLNNWFFRQSRVPCTYLDGEDYVYGTAEKVREALVYLKEHVDFEFLAVVNSPGASLIGDNLEEIIREILPDDRCLLLESPGYSTDFSVGYETALLSLIEKLPVGPVPTQRETGKQKSVNLLGMSIWQKYFDGTIEELKRLFALCGIEVNCVLLAGDSLAEYENLRQADLNVVLYPEMAAGAALRLEKLYGMPYYMSPSLPIGFDAVERIFTEIGQRLGCDASQLLEESHRSRAYAWSKIDGFHQMCGRPDGVVYALEGSASQVYSYAKFFSEYLGMIPDCLEVTDGRESSLVPGIQEIGMQYGIEGAMKRSILETEADLIFGEANTIAELKLQRKQFTGIEISRPEMGYIDLIPKTQMGIRGTLFLIEQVLNGLQSI